MAADHWFELPLDHAEPARGTTTVYVRELRDAAAASDDRPYLLFLQGGPGGSSPRPNGGPEWVTWALERYRVLLLDQRGTGRSDRLDPAVIRAFGSPAAQADHLALFRADSIVQDAEAIRRELLGDEPWTVLGQSFGGFCTFTYLSFAAHGLRECLLTGGVPPLTVGVDDVYRSTYGAVAPPHGRPGRGLPLDPDPAARGRRPPGPPRRAPARRRAADRAAAAGGRPRPGRRGRPAAAALPGRGRVGRSTG